MKVPERTFIPKERKKKREEKEKRGKRKERKKKREEKERKANPAGYSKNKVSEKVSENVFGNYGVAVHTMEKDTLVFGLNYAELGFDGFSTVGNAVRVNTAEHIFNIFRRNDIILPFHFEIPNNIDGGPRGYESDFVELPHINFLAFYFNYVFFTSGPGGIHNETDRIFEITGYSQDVQHVQGLPGSDMVDYGPFFNCLDFQVSFLGHSITPVTRASRAIRIGTP